MLSVIQSHIDTNLTVQELMALVGFGSQTKRADVQMLLVPGRFSEPGEYRASYWLPDSDRIAKMATQHFDAPLSESEPVDFDPARLRIAISNSTGSDRAVRSLVKSLAGAGYRNVYITKSWSEPLDTTHVVAQQGDTESAATIRDLLNVGEVRVESTGNLGSDITIQVGKDWLEQSREQEAGSRE